MRKQFSLHDLLNRAGNAASILLREGNNEFARTRGQELHDVVAFFRREESTKKERRREKTKVVDVNQERGPKRRDFADASKDADALAKAWGRPFYVQEAATSQRGQTYYYARRAEAVQS
jgi:hypothetical protein